MSFECGPHGWRHLLNPCPVCSQLWTTSGNTANIPKPIPRQKQILLDVIKAAELVISEANRLLDSSGKSE